MKLPDSGDVDGETQGRPAIVTFFVVTLVVVLAVLLIVGISLM